MRIEKVSVNCVNFVFADCKLWYVPFSFCFVQDGSTATFGSKRTRIPAFAVSFFHFHPVRGSYYFVHITLSFSSHQHLQVQNHRRLAHSRPRLLRAPADPPSRTVPRRPLRPLSPLRGHRRLEPVHPPRPVVHVGLRRLCHPHPPPASTREPSSGNSREPARSLEIM